MSRLLLAVFLALAAAVPALAEGGGCSSERGEAPSPPPPSIGS